MLVNLLIIVFILLIINQSFLAYSKKYLEGYMTIRPAFKEQEKVKNKSTFKPVFKPTNNFYPNNNIKQDFDPDSVTTWFS